MTQLLPPIPYFGGKQTLAPRIVDHFPTHRHYVEPFAGSLAVLLAKGPSSMETVNDLDSELVTFWRVLRDHAEELMWKLDNVPWSREEFKRAREPITPGTDDLEIAVRVWTALTQSRSAGGRRGRAGTGWRERRNSTSGGGPSEAARFRFRARACTERLRNVVLENRDALDVIRDYGAHDDVLLYVDPPYLGSTRSAHAQYRHDMEAEPEHRALAELLTDCRASVVLSGYHSPLYEELYPGWDVVEISTTSGNAAVGNRKRVEVLWSNRDISNSLLADLETIA